MKPTIAQQLNITSFPFIIKNEFGYTVYAEYKDGRWERFEYHAMGGISYKESSSGFWERNTYNELGQIVHQENSDGYWFKREFDEYGRRTYFEDSNGKISINSHGPRPIKNK
jgi:hypothetical protein